MKIVIAPDSFKESLSAKKVAQAIHAGFKKVLPNAEYHLLELGDGGEGTIDAYIAATDAKVDVVDVTGPLGDRVTAKLAFSQDGKKAFIEMAEACGLQLIPSHARNPLQTTSYGVGELILSAIDKGATKLMIGVGGSGTNDGGIGMASALGYQFFDRKGREVQATGNALFEIVSLSDKNRDRRLDGVEVIIAADVSNPLTGVNGATYVFGSQKGLPKSMLAKTDAAMAEFFKMAGRQLGKNVIFIEGSGAGGGLAAGLLLFTNATIQRGIDVILKQLNMEQICHDADVIVVGEGKIDRQTLLGKAPIGVAMYAPPTAKVIAICGSVGIDIDKFDDHRIDAIFPTIPAPIPLTDLLNRAYEDVERTARNIAMLLR